MTVSERINAERIVLAGWSRAILLQLAHPLVAQGVADHSSVVTAGRGTAKGGGTLLAAAVRLHHTVQAMRRLTFGDAAQARLALDGIKAIHRRVNGTLPESVGPYAAGTPYSAEDAPLVLWVHATLLDSLPLVYVATVGPLTDGELDAWCRESAPVARALGAGDDVPETWAEVQAYIASMIGGGQIEVGGTARRIAHQVLAPRRSWALAPLRAINRTITIGLLPSSVRAQYGYAWSTSDEGKLHRTLARLQALRSVTPDVLAHWPDARHTR